jgi:hypothetical protein
MTFSLARAVGIVDDPHARLADDVLDDINRIRAEHGEALLDKLPPWSYCEGCKTLRVMGMTGIDWHVARIRFLLCEVDPSLWSFELERAVKEQLTIGPLEDRDVVPFARGLITGLADCVL